ncbi:MAG TPA: biotin--[acetyl-CoA-carboxylase] ligase [Acidimicrobiales bacterium]
MGVDGDGGDAELTAGAHDAHGDLAPVGDEDLPEHGGAYRKRTHWDVRKFESIESTNTWLLERAREGAAEGLVAVADHQTAGRGRLGRRWEAPAGVNLLCSVLLRPSAVSWLSVARVSLAGLEAAGVPSIGLKWPNDIVVGGSLKLAGVLAEVDAGAVVVGIGMNVGWAPPDLPATSLAALAGTPVSRDDVLAGLLSSLSGWVEADDGAVARAYREACVTIGRSVRVELADETFTGTAADVADDGHLLVDVGMCVRDVSAGDVVHLR